MSNLKITVDSNDIVTVNTNLLEHEIEDLATRFKNRLDKDEAAVFDMLIDLYDDCSAAGQGLLLKKGWDALVTNLAKTKSLLDNLDYTIELSEEAYAQLEKINEQEQWTNPDVRIEDTLSKIILTIPMPK